MVVELSSGEYAGAAIDLVQNLLDEFLEDTAERLRMLDRDLADGADLAPFRCFAFEIKGQAHNFGHVPLEVVTQRMEDYLSAIAQLDTQSVADLRRFLAVIDDAVSGSIRRDADPALLVRGLPARPAAFSTDDVEIRDVEVMLVMHHGAQTRFVEREMQACGYRVTLVTSTTAALKQAIHTKPDMVINSAVMPGLSGIDLTIALSAMLETRNIPVALITSLDPDDEQLKAVPEGVPIIQKGESFGDDLVSALNYHFLL